MKIVIVGGHLAPALAVIDALTAEVQVRFVGRKIVFEGDQTQSLEYKEITSRGIPFFVLTTARIQRSLTKHTLPSLSKLPLGFYQAFSYLRKENPDVILSFGGYLSIPVGFAAKILRIPVVIHEQTLQGGLANKMLSGVASKICISWNSSKAFFPPDKTVLTGNPIRKFDNKNFPYTFSAADEKLPLVYITGGSSGSHAINVLVESVLGKLVKNVRIVHQTGDAEEFDDYTRLTQLRNSLSKKEQNRYVIEKFIKPDVVGKLMQKADLVVSRSGINTITELFYFQTPALLIPLQTGQKNEQLFNAKFFVSQGTGEILMQNDATSGLFFDKISHMLSSIGNYKKNAKKAYELVDIDAAKNILNQLSYVVNKKTS